jgi:Zn-dependent protease
MIGSLFTNPVSFVLYLVALVVALTVHEFSHALMANYLGDPTPRLSGRLTLNPLAHFDIFGTLFLLFFGFGWGKPVPFDPFNLKKPRQDAALISLAGPLSNFIIAIAGSILIRLFILFKLPVLSTIGLLILYPIIILNVSLGFFNLLPINPLDGFKIVGGLLSEEKAHEWYQLERYGMIFLLLLILPLGRSGSLLDTIFRPAVGFILNFLLPSSLGAGII